MIPAILCNILNFRFLLLNIVLLVITLLCDSKNQVDLICNPSNKAVLNDDFFLTRQWLNARAELGLKDYNHIDFYNGHNKFNKMDEIRHLKDYIDRFKHRIESFYSELSPNGVAEYSCKNFTIPYARILKCSSEGILDHLQLFCTNITNSSKSKPRPNFKRDYSSQSQLNKHFGQNSNSVFTFIRNPFEHFISGFSESVWVELKDGSMKTVNVSIVKGFFDELLLFNYSRLWPLNGFKHLFPMSNIFFQVNISIVGHLESFENDWNNLIRPAYNISQPYDKSFGQHATSVNHPFAEQEKVKQEMKKKPISNPPPKNSDPNNARTSLLELFQRDVRYKRMVCQLILVDYICFPMYSLPTECQHLNKTISELRVKFEKK